LNNFSIIPHIDHQKGIPVGQRAVERITNANVPIKVSGIDHGLKYEDQPCPDEARNGENRRIPDYPGPSRLSSIIVYRAKQEDRNTTRGQRSDSGNNCASNGPKRQNKQDSH
jgi:hypothetical protein